MTEAPPSMFSKRAATGTRVERKTQEPLTFSGSRSTAGHEDQSNIGGPYPHHFAKGKREAWGVGRSEFNWLPYLRGNSSRLTLLPARIFIPPYQLQIGNHELSDSVLCKIKF